MLHEIKFPSYNNRDQVYGWIYVPAVKPKGIVQLIHGLGEHSRRYLHMIVAFLDAGYIVAADDHVGHGKTAVENPGTWGDWGDAGCHTMMEDEHSLRQIAQKMYPNLPYFLFGHSMGSFIARDYITKYGEGLAGVTICGTTAVFPHAAETEKVLEKAIAEGKGEESVPNYSKLLLGWMYERCGEVRLGNEWVCSDPYVQYDHAYDPFNAYTKPTKNKTLLDFTRMMQVIEGTDWAQKVPKGLPIYNIAGDEDPVGNYGQGVYQVSNWLWETGHQVKTKLYSGCRHEIFNYTDIKNEVETGIIAFMDEHLS